MKIAPLEDILMSGAQRPSVFWSVVGVGLSVFTTVMSFILAFRGDQKRAVWLGIGIVLASATLLAVQRVYAAFAKPPGD